MTDLTRSGFAVGTLALVISLLDAISASERRADMVVVSLLALGLMFVVAGRR